MRYEAPTSLDDAIALARKSARAKTETTRFLAGGTDVLVQMHAETVEPDLLIDVKNVPEMRRISRKGKRWTVGAAVTGKELMAHSAFNAAWPGVMDGVRLIGSLQVRGRATMGGNLCNASPAADSVPPLIAAGAAAVVAGPRGRRTVPVEDVVRGPGRTSLAAGEIVVAFELPSRPARSGDAYLRFTPRTEMDIAVVGAAVSLTLDRKHVCTAARVSLGAVAPRPLLAKKAAKALVGTPVDEAALERMAAAARGVCKPIDDKRGTAEYRIEVAGVLAERAAAIALERAKAQ